MIAIAPARLCAALACVLMLGLGLPIPQALAQQRVGVNSAVNPATSGAVAPSPLKQLVIGQDVIFKERIVTETGGQTQVLFVDESSMSIGPNSDMVIDEFVYDPNAGTGKLAASLTRGVFRFVGGRLSKQDNAITMQTPSATIGIRGGVFLLGIDPRDGSIDAIFLFGRALTITGTNGVTVTITRPGFHVTVSGPGAAPSSPAPAPRDTMAGLLAAVDGRAGGTGGATTIPTDTTVASSGIATRISGNLQTSIQQAEQHQPLTTTPVKATDVGALAISQSQQQALTGPVDCTGTQTCPNTSTSVGTVVPGTAPKTVIGVKGLKPPPSSTVIVRGGRFFSTGMSGTAAGFPDQGQPFADWTFANGVVTATPNGAATVQFPASPGTTASFTAQGTSPLGPVSGTSFLSADQTFFFANLTPVNQPSQREFIVGGQGVDPNFYSPTGVERFLAFNVQPDAALQSPIPFARNQTGGTIANPSVSQLYVTAPANAPFPGPLSADPNVAPQVLGKSLQASLAISGQGAAQSSVLVVSVGNPLATSPQPTLAGTVQGSFLANGMSVPVRITGGASSVTDSNGVSFYGGSQISGFAVGGSPSETNVATGQSTPYNFAHAVTAAALPAGVGTSTTSQTLTGFFGGIVAKQGASPILYNLTGTNSITTDATNLRIAATFNGSDPFTAATSGITSLNLQYGNLNPGTNAAQAFIDDNLFAALQSPPFTAQTTVNGTAANNALIYMVSSNTVPSTALLPPGVSFCQCQFLKWGYWGGEVDSTQSDGTPRIDYAHINTWVAGPLTSLGDLAQLAQTGFQGTYTGALIGSVNNNGALYSAAGGLQATFNFGTQTGNLAISNYDGKSFSTPVSNGTINGASYKFTFNPAGITGAVNGAFYGPMAAETGGNFAFQTTAGAPYSTSGIYAAKR